MKNIFLLCIYLMLSLSAFSQTGYTVYLDDRPINDYTIVDMKYDPSLRIVNNYIKNYENITLVSAESNDPDVYYPDAKYLPITIIGGGSLDFYIISPYGCNISSRIALLTLTITDYLKNTTTFHIYVKTKDYIDQTQPTFTFCPSNITVSTQPGKPYGQILYSMPTAIDNCGPVTLTLLSGYLSGSIGGIGLTIIRYRATDRVYNSRDCSFYVTVQDNEPPDIKCPTTNERMVESDQDGKAALPDYTSLICVKDNSLFVATINQTPQPGTIINETTAVTIQAKDNSDNTSECTFEVSLKDVIPPVIENPGDQTIELQTDCFAPLPDFTASIVATDNQDASVQLSQYPPSGTEIFAPVNVTVTAVDITGNRSETGFNVLVADNIAPEIICPEDQVVSVLNAEMPYTVQCREFDPVYASDNCTYTLINDFNDKNTLEGASFNTDSETTIYWTNTDAKGNTAGCSFDVSFSVVTKSQVLEENDVSVFPNPTNGLFTIYTPKEYAVDVFDIKGILVLTQPVIPGYNNLDLLNKGSGYYIMVFNNDDENFSIKIYKESQ
jgi:HYR domain/Secretion system C-terminal sorting domain